MVELHVLFASSNGHWRYWNTYSNDNHIDAALTWIEENYGAILAWHLERLTDE